MTGYHLLEHIMSRTIGSVLAEVAVLLYAATAVPMFMPFPTALANCPTLLLLLLLNPYCCFNGNKK